MRKIIYTLVAIIGVAALSDCAIRGTIYSEAQQSDFYISDAVNLIDNNTREAVCRKVRNGLYVSEACAVPQPDIYYEIIYRSPTIWGILSTSTHLAFYNPVERSFLTMSGKWGYY